MLAEAAGLVCVLVAGGLLFARNLDTRANYDEGVYLASLDALRHGQRLGSEVFPDQPPGFYLLLRASAALFGTSVHDVRVGMLLVSVIGCAAAYACGRALGGALAGLASAGLLIVTPPFASLAALVEADPPSVSLSLVALALAACACGVRDRPHLAALAGAAFALAFSVKFLAATTAVPLLGLALKAREPRRALVWMLAGATATAAAFLGAYATVLPEIWDGTVAVHRYARELGAGYGTNLNRVLHFPHLRTPFGWLFFLAVALAAVAWLRGRRFGLWPFWLWAVASAGFIVWQQPLLDHQLVLLAASFALPSGIVVGRSIAEAPAPATLMGAAVGTAFFAAGLYQERSRIADAALPEPVEVRWAARQVHRDISPEERFATDLPIVAYLAERRIPGQLIDTSAGRISSGYLTADDVVRLIDDTQVRGVVVGRLFTKYPRIIRGVGRRFPCRRVRGYITIYLPCRAPRAP